LSHLTKVSKCHYRLLLMLPMYQNAHSSPVQLAFIMLFGRCLFAFFSQLDGYSKPMMKPS